ncbi:hypothetical protein L208DRAFT_1392439 [Tricholoma matsutake]|nr:hypothetical protein L208DRAFT_1392439 [Tricholoma matsutake 945]
MCKNETFGGNEMKRREELTQPPFLPYLASNHPRQQKLYHAADDRGRMESTVFAHSAFHPLRTSRWVHRTWQWLNGGP